METLQTTSRYIPHIDKLGRITAFYQVQRVSYNFVAVQDLPSKDNAVKFKMDNDYIRYMNYKEQLDEKENKKINVFEQEMFKFGRNKFTTIVVKQLLPGHCMFFAAGIYPHGTVIPKQSDARSILVFHDFVPVN